MSSHDLRLCVSPVRQDLVNTHGRSIFFFNGKGGIVYLCEGRQSLEGVEDGEDKLRYIVSREYLREKRGGVNGVLP